MLKVILTLLVVCVGLVVSSTSDDTIGADLVPGEELPLDLPLVLATNSTPTGKQEGYRRPGDNGYCEDVGKRCGTHGDEGRCRSGGCLNDEYEGRESRDQCNGPDCVCCKPSGGDPYPALICKDNSPDCPDYRSACNDIFDKSHSWALINCLRTCNLCKRGPLNTCQDRRPRAYCEAARNDCDYDYIADDCPATCNKCINTIDDDNESGRDCNDKFRGDRYGQTCNSFISQCHNAWVRDNCRKTCNLCGSDNESGRDCNDKFRMDGYGNTCNNYISQCYDRWVRTNCRKTCNLCDSDFLTLPPIYEKK